MVASKMYAVRDRKTGGFLSNVPFIVSQDERTITYATGTGKLEGVFFPTFKMAERYLQQVTGELKKYGIVRDYEVAKVDMDKLGNGKTLAEELQTN